jgi:RimJ/RimL family protein N-acetyltransferase
MDREPGVMRFLGGPRADAAAHRALVEARTVGPYAAGLGYWMVCRREVPDEAVGWVLLIPNDGVGPEIEIGWRFRPAHWGLGFATEAARAVLDHGFGNLALGEVIAEIHPDNAASIAVARKLGFVTTAVKNGLYQRFVLRCA